MRKDFLLPFKPNIGEEEIAEVVDTLKSGWITTGPKVQKFEEDFKAYIGCKNAIAVSSCTDGLELCLAVLGIGEGDEVITTPLTFCSTANVIVHRGAKPVFADIKEDTLDIDPRKIEEKVTNKTKAIIPVHYAGQSCDLDEILDIAKRYNLKVIEDAAHAVGSEYRGKKIGKESDFAVFSFYAAKNITTGEGGMICTNNDEYAEKLKILRLHGISKDAWKRYSKEGSWFYEVLEAGYKCNLTDIQASLGIHQLRKLDNFIKLKQEIADFYSQAFKNIPQIIIPKVKENIKHSWYLYPIIVKEFDRSLFIEKLKAENIGTSVHFIPVHLHPYYRDKFGFKRGDFPVAERVFDGLVSLPIHNCMTMDDAKDVVDAVNKILK